MGKESHSYGGEGVFHRSTKPLTEKIDLDIDEDLDMAAISTAIVTAVGLGISATQAIKQRGQQQAQFEVAQEKIDETERLNRQAAKKQQDRMMAYSRFGDEQMLNVQNAIAREGDIRPTPFAVDPDAYDTEYLTSGPLFEDQQARAVPHPSQVRGPASTREMVSPRDTGVVGNMASPTVPVVNEPLPPEIRGRRRVPRGMMGDLV